MKSIVIIIDYFADSRPIWFRLFLESCKRNPSIHWVVHTNCDTSDFAAKNVRLKQYSWDDYRLRVKDVLGVNLDGNLPYKVCDIRPAFGILWEDEISNYDYFGYGDIDVVYGNLRNFFTDEVLNANIVSTHEWCVSGHLCLLRNCDFVRNAYKSIPRWKSLMESNKSERVDEDWLYKLFVRPNRFTLPLMRPFAWVCDRLNPFRIPYRNTCFQEQYSTPLVPGLWAGGRRKHPLLWYWNDGKLTNDANGNTEFAYLHLMNFVSGRFRDGSMASLPVWNESPNVEMIGPHEAVSKCLISPDGIEKML